MRYLIKQIESKEEYYGYWNSLNSHLMQSWEWGVVKSGSSIPIYLAIFADDIVQHVLLIQRKTVLNGFIKFGYSAKAQLSKAVVTELKTYLKKNFSLDFLIIEPIDEQDVNWGLDQSDNIQPQFTNLVRLKVGEEQLWNNLKGKYRRNINKAKREGVIVKTFTDGAQAIKEFDQTMQHILANTSYVMSQDRYFEHVWKTLSGSKSAKIYAAYSKQNELLGAYLVAFDNIGAYELYGGVNNLGRDLEAGYLLKWEAMLDAAKSGKKFYDHWGTAPFNDTDFDKGHEMYNISRFKLGFGGDNHKFAAAQVMVFNSPKYQIFKVLNQLRKLRLKILKTSK